MLITKSMTKEDQHETSIKRKQRSPSASISSPRTKRIIPPPPVTAPRNTQELNNGGTKVVSPETEDASIDKSIIQEGVTHSRVKPHFQGHRNYRYTQNHPYHLSDHANSCFVEGTSSRSEAMYNPPKQPSRFGSAQGESSLSHLTEKFINLLDEYHASHTNGELDLNIAVSELGVQKRRLYDITNVLEGVGLIKKERNQVMWTRKIGISTNGVHAVSHGTEASSESFAAARLKCEIEELNAHRNFIDDCIEKLSDSVREYTKCKKKSATKNDAQICGSTEMTCGEKLKNMESNLFVTKQEIAALQAYHNDTVIAIRAPPGTNLEVPNPDEGMRPGTRRFQIYLTSPGTEAGPVKVMVLHNAHETRTYQRHNPYGSQVSSDSVITKRSAGMSSSGNTLTHRSVTQSDTSVLRSANDSTSKHDKLNISDPNQTSAQQMKPKLPSLPPSQSLPKRPKISERSRSFSAMKEPATDGCNIDAFSTIPPRPTLKRRATDPSGRFMQSYDVLPKRTKPSPGTSRKPLKAALKQSPTRSPRHGQFLASPIKGQTCFLDTPQSPCEKKAQETATCGPTPTSRGHDLLAALDSPFLPASSPGFLASSPIPNLKGFGSERLSGLPTSPFPFSPNMNMGGADFSQFSPFIASPSTAKMEKEMQIARDSMEGNLPSLF